MTVRTSEGTMTFRRPFVLSWFDEVLPAGAYNVETDEEPLEGISFPAYRRILTVLYLHAMPGRQGQTRVLPIDPNELEPVLKRDREREEIAVGQEAYRDALTTATNPRREESDRQAMDRAEDEGMIVQPRQALSSRCEREIVSWALGRLRTVRM